MTDFPYFSRKRIDDDIRDAGGSIRRSLSQNFLIDPGTVERIAALATDLGGSTDEIIEIGAGPGALTHVLSRSYSLVHAIEYDPVMCKLLKKHLRPERLHLIQNDAREVMKEPAAHGLSATLPVCGNLPYHITSDLLTLVANGSNVGASFLVQKEYAERVAAETSESSLNVFLHNAGDWKLASRVPRTVFYPAPAVDSAVIVFTRGISQADPKILEKLLRMSFASRRKKLRNSWRLDRRELLDPELLEDLAQQLGIDVSLRAEAIEREAYYELAGLIAKHTAPEV